jgi:SAM-dependent methyltransferase
MNGTLIPACVCGTEAATPEERHGLAMLRCESCGVLRQDVRMTAAEYAAWYREHYFGDGVYYHTPEQDRQVARLRLDTYALPAGSRVLDVGCGNGAFVVEARARGLDAWGQDLAVQSGGPHVHVGDLPDLALPAKSFDAVTMHDVLEHVPDPRAMLSEVRRLLTHHGRLIVDFPRFHHEAGVHHWKPVEHLWMLDSGQLVELLDGSGFRLSRLDHPIPSKIVAHTVSLNGGRP